MGSCDDTSVAVARRLEGRLALLRGAAVGGRRCALTRAGDCERRFGEVPSYCRSIGDTVLLMSNVGFALQFSPPIR